MKLETPRKTRQQFTETIAECVKLFGLSDICKAVENGTFTREHFQDLLRVLFHQVFNSSATFALAAANLPPGKFHVRDYLLKHADEEKTHWRWILNDLERCGDTKEKPTDLFPPTFTQAYISFNFLVAHKWPVARLGIAAMLESLGATFSKQYAHKLFKDLKLSPDECSFFLGHGDTDIGHVAEIIAILDAAELSSEEWGQMCYAAKTAAELYSHMCNGVLHK